METADPNIHNFNNQDYEFIIRLYNGKNSIQLKPEGYDNLILEEDIFEWITKGSIEIKTPFDSLERSSDDALAVTGSPEENLIYKFRGDGRDTIFVSIIPKNDSELSFTGEFKDKLWRIELEAVIYDVEDYTHSNYTNKIKKLYFWDKTYQMMQEKNIEFSTSKVGSNKSKEKIYKLSNAERSLKTGEALKELLLFDEDFNKHAALTSNEEEWTLGSDENKVFYSSPSDAPFIEDLNYLLSVHTSGKEDTYQPCLFKLERPEEKEKTRQFSLKPIKKYFEKAGKDEPGDYQIEHFFLQEYSGSSNANEIILQKSPLGKELSLEKDVKGSDYSEIGSFQLVDFSGKDNAQLLSNKTICSYNPEKGQFNIESKNHTTEQYKIFSKENILENVMTNLSDDRLPLTRYQKEGNSMEYKYSHFQNEIARYNEGKNKIIKHYMFSNLGISFNIRGWTIRQPGRFFAVSRQTKNDKDYDHLLEGQYFITNVIHSFSSTRRGYYTRITGIKVHKWDDQKLEDTDAMIIS